MLAREDGLLLKRSKGYLGRNHLVRTSVLLDCSLQEYYVLLLPHPVVLDLDLLNKVVFSQLFKMGFIRKLSKMAKHLLGPSVESANPIKSRNI